MSQNVTVSGVNLKVEEKGQGRPVLFLHPGEGLQADRSWFDAAGAGSSGHRAASSRVWRVGAAGLGGEC